MTATMSGCPAQSRPPYSLLSRGDTSGHLVVSVRMMSMPEMMGEVEAEAPRIEGSRRGRSSCVSAVNGGSAPDSRCAPSAGRGRLFGPRRP
jgi:hypothetical protein